MSLSPIVDEIKTRHCALFKIQAIASGLKSGPECKFSRIGLIGKNLLLQNIFLMKFAGLHLKVRHPTFPVPEALFIMPKIRPILFFLSQTCSSPPLSFSEKEINLYVVLSFTYFCLMQASAAWTLHAVFSLCVLLL